MRNQKSYRDFKSIGIKHMVQAEKKRFDRKIDLQDRARRQGIKPDQMRQFALQQDKEDIWNRIIPEQLMKEIRKKEKALALKKQKLQKEQEERSLMASNSMISSAMQMGLLDNAQQQDATNT